MNIVLIRYSFVLNISKLRMNLTNFRMKRIFRKKMCSLEYLKARWLFPNETAILFVVWPWLLFCTTV